MSDFWKATAAAYDGLIKKPEMKEKNLSRPPFKFIVAIFTELQKANGFGTGLFTPDELPENWDRNPKIAFLNKLMQLVTSITGEEPKAKVNMVIAGKECEATNVWLVSLAKAATMQNDTTKEVNKVLGKPDEPETKAKDPSPPPKKKSEPERKKSPPARAKSPKDSSPPRGKGGKKDDAGAADDEGGYYANQVKGQIEREVIKDDDTANKDANKKGISMKLRGRGKRGDEGVGRGGEGQKGGDVEAEKIDLTDIDGLKAVIQSITQATNPLGKIVEMIDDDLESMGKEYDNWTKVYTQNKEKMQDREKEIEGELQGLYDKITSKDEQIKEKKAQIEAIKTQQMRNTKKIEKLLNDIVGSK